MSTPADYWAQAQIDPSYIATKGGLTRSLLAQILNYGDASALSPAEASQYGITPDQTSSAAANPYSTVSQLKAQLTGDQYGITNNANAHGALDSGGAVAGKLHEDQQGAQRNYNALTALQSQIAGIDTQNTNALTTAYGNVATAAANTPTAPPADSNTAQNEASAYQAGLQVPQPIQNIGPSNLTGDARTGTSLYAPLTPAPVTPKTIAAKQIAGQSARGFTGAA